MLGGKSQSRGNALVTIFGVTNQLDELEPEKGKVQMGILIQDLVVKSALMTKLIFGEQKVLMSRRLIKKVVVYHQRSEDHMRGACINSCSNHSAGERGAEKAGVVPRTSGSRSLSSSIASWMLPS